VGGKAVLSVGSNLVSRLTIACVFKCSPGVLLVIFRCVASSCIVCTYNILADSCEVVGVGRCCAEAAPDALLCSVIRVKFCGSCSPGVVPTSVPCLGIAEATVCSTAPAVRSPSWAGIGWDTMGGASCRPCHGASHRRLASSVSAAEEARPSCHIGIRFVSLLSAITLLTSAAVIGFCCAATPAMRALVQRIFNTLGTPLACCTMRRRAASVKIE